MDRRQIVLQTDWQHKALEEYARSGLRLLRSNLIENLDKERVILVGHSVGSMAACVAHASSLAAH